LKTAAAIELNQHLLLVHDDVEDDSAQRRGYPTLHRKYNSNLAVNAGDGLFFMLWKVLCDNRGHLDSETTLDLMKEFRQMVYRTCVGQTAELWYIQSHKIHLSEEECYYIIDGKTSYYTIAAPMRLAMIMAVKDVGERETLLFPQLDRLGCYLGRAFQLMDDHLDLTSDFNGLKKQRGNDIYEGKRTLLLSHLLSHCTATERREVLSIYEKGASEKKITDIDFVIDLMQEKGSFDYSIKQIENWKQKADELLPHIGFIESQPVETLKILFNYIIYRNC
jgi:geranylgeranyl diphosphate synthase type II